MPFDDSLFGKTHRGGGCRREGNTAEEEINIPSIIWTLGTDIDVLLLDTGLKQHQTPLLDFRVQY
jgi:hypothetical protein